MGQSKASNDALLRMSRDPEQTVEGEETVELSSPDSGEGGSQCAHCGFITQRYIPGDHVALSRLEQTPTSDVSEDKAEHSTPITARSTNPFIDTATHHFTQDFTAADKEKISQMKTIAPKIQLTTGKCQKKTMICFPRPQKPVNRTSDSLCIKALDGENVKLENLKNEQIDRVTELGELKEQTIDVINKLPVPTWLSPCEQGSDDTGCGSSGGSPGVSRCHSPDSVIDSYSQVGVYDDEEQKKDFQKAIYLLNITGIFHKDCTMEQARRKLKKSSIGTFLLRESSRGKFVLALSVRTQRGTTAIRIFHSHGKFRLDCEENFKLKMHSFDCIMELIEHYTAFACESQNNCVFLENSGRRDTPVSLAKPYLENSPSLKHLCRLKLNRMLSPQQRERWLSFEQPDIEGFMKQYPYTL